MTVLTEVEAILNSRPLAPMDSAPIDGEQSAHFLIGRSLKALPLPADESRPTHLLRRWVLCQRLNKEIWRKWSGEYTQTPLIRTPLTRALPSTGQWSRQFFLYIHTSWNSSSWLYFVAQLATAIVAALPEQLQGEAAI